MNKFPSIRKTIASTSFNTETSVCVHSSETVISEMESGQVRHLHAANALYVNEHGCFLAHWNRATWNHALLRQEYKNDIDAVSREQAEQWLHHACPEKVLDFKAQASTNKALIHTVSIRMDTSMRNRLVYEAEQLESSLSRACVSFIETGMDSAKAKAKLYLPGVGSFKMPNGCLALNELGQAHCFEDSEDQYLAGRAVALFYLIEKDYAEVFLFVVRTMSQLQAMQHSQARIACFSGWLALFHKEN